MPKSIPTYFTSKLPSIQDEWEILIRNKKKNQKLMGWKDKITQVPLQQPPWEANSCFSDQEIPHFSRYSNVFTKPQKLMDCKDKKTQVPLQQPPWEANSCFSDQEIPHFSRYSKVFTKNHKN